MYKTSKLAQVEAQLEEEQFLGTLEQSPFPVTTNPWAVYLTLNGVPVLFIIDTGADVSAISETTFNQLKGVSLVHSDHHLSGPSQYQLQVTGKFTATLKYGTKAAKENIFIVKKLQRVLLGRPGIESLSLIAIINSLQNDKFVTMHPNLFKGSGTITREYHISLREGARPFTLSTRDGTILGIIGKYDTRLDGIGIVRLEC